MTANSALGAIVSAMGIVAVASPSAAARRLAIACSVIVLIVGIGALFEYASSVRLGIDELLLPTPTQPRARSSVGCRLHRRRRSPHWPRRS